MPLPVRNGAPILCFKILIFKILKKFEGIFVFFLFYKNFISTQRIPTIIVSYSVMVVVVEVGCVFELRILHCKYWVKPHSSPWFSAAHTAIIAQRNQFFPLWQLINFFWSRVGFRRTSNCCGRVLKAAKFAYVGKTKEPFTSQKLWEFSEILVNF